MQQLRTLLTQMLIVITAGLSAQQIAVTAVSSDTICNKGCMQVDYQASGTFGPNNVFTLQMSDINGSFANPITLGYGNTMMSSTIGHCWFYSFPAGSGYRFRVNSSDPMINGIDNGQDLTYFYVDLTVTTSPGQLQATTTMSGSSFQWLECSHFVLPGETAPTFSAGSALNDYAVEIAQGGCIDTSDCYTFDMSTSVQTPQPASITIHPNPTSGQVNLDLGTFHGDATVRVRNVLGELLSTTVYSLSRISVDLTGNPGVYFIEVSGITGDPTVLKVLKK